jgi:RNA polymerase sigma-70 factor (ECF subfamily)
MARSALDLAGFCRAAASGDVTAFRRLVECTTPIVYRVVLRVLHNEPDASDVLQETYLRVWRKLPELRDSSAALSWICRIGRNLALERIRSRRRHPTEPLEPEGMAAREMDPEEALTRAREGAALAALMEELKPKHRVVLLLREVDGLSYQEIAAALECSVGTVESRLHRARAALAKSAKKLTRATRREIPMRTRPTLQLSDLAS